MENSKLDRRLAHWVRMLSFLLARRVVDAYSKWGLRTGAFTTMALVAENAGISQTDLSRHTGLDTSSLVAIIDELERKGLVQRLRSNADRRRNELHLTQEGLVMLHAMFDAAMWAEEPLREEFSEAEFSLFLEFLRRAHRRLVMVDDESSNRPLKGTDA